MLGEMSEVRTGERLGVEILFCKVFFRDFTKWLCMGRGDAQCDEKMLVDFARSGFVAGKDFCGAFF